MNPKLEEPANETMRFGSMLRRYLAIGILIVACFLLYNSYRILISPDLALHGANKQYLIMNNFYQQQKKSGDSVMVKKDILMDLVKVVEEKDEYSQSSKTWKNRLLAINQNIKKVISIAEVDHRMEPQQVCKIPDLDPYSPEIRKYINYRWKSITCKFQQKGLIKNGILQLNLSNVQRAGYYYIKRGDNDDIYYYSDYHSIVDNGFTMLKSAGLWFIS